MKTVHLIMALPLSTYPIKKQIHILIRITRSKKALEMYPAWLFTDQKKILEKIIGQKPYWAKCIPNGNRYRSKNGIPKVGRLLVQTNLQHGKLWP
ncbi:hypothetical protein ACFL4V_01380 [Candidatus Latescibacterota bacterium]